MKGGRVKVIGEEGNFRKVAGRWGMEEVKEAGSGGLCVGIVDWSTVSEFGKINGTWKKKDFEEAERVAGEMKKSVERGAVVVCCGPSRSTFWKFRTV